VGFSSRSCGCSRETSTKTKKESDTGNVKVEGISRSGIAGGEGNELSTLRGQDNAPSTDKDGAKTNGSGALSS